MKRIVRLTTVLLVVLVVQTTWMAEWRPFGTPGDLLLLFTIGAGMASGAQRGAVIGFIAGIAFDSVLLTPFGLSALTYLAVGYAVGSVHEGILRSAAWIPVVASLVATAVGIIFYVMLGQLVGQQFRHPDLGRIVLVAAVMNAVLAFPMLWVMRWVERGADEGVSRLAR